MTAPAAHNAGMHPADRRLPDIEADECVHTWSILATCSACVDACPESALVMDDELLGFHTDACTACGLCQPACPQGAISVGTAIPVEGRIASVACKKSPARRGTAVACVHALGIRQLADLYQRGMRRLEVATGSCNSCDIRASVRLDTHVADFNRLAASRGQPVIEIAESELARNRQRLDHACRPQVSDAGRRAFLRSFINTASDRQMPRDTTQPLAAFQSLGQNSAQAAIYAAAPRIDPRRCDSCDACVNICRNGALTRIKDNPGIAHYKITPHMCSGCGACVDLCDNQAVQLHTMTARPPIRVSLSVSRCKSCGNEYHLPEVRADNAGMCRICLQAGHQKKLFQVME